MINYLTKDITTVNRGIIAHGVNNAFGGVMGSGVAYALRNKYPQIFSEYSKLCSGDDQSRENLLGTVNFVIINPRIIVANCFTQRLYGRDGKRYAIPNAIESSLAKCYQMATLLHFPFYLPPIGCGLGGLNYEADVKPIIENLSDLNPDVETFICDLK